MEWDELKKSAVGKIDSEAEFFKKLADKIWAHPELSLKEFKAAEIYAEAIRALGFELTENLCNIKTAFCGKYGHGRPVIGILGEYDALSGLSQQAGVPSPCPEPGNENGHGCGHNLLGAGSLAAAYAVKKYLEESGRSGTVIFFGCPGEEGGSGKAFMAREGLWKKLDAALCWHPSDVNQIKTGTNNSCIQVLYKFKGIAAHAAAEPFNGRSALDAVELMNVGVQFLREHMTDDCRIHYAITNSGGISPNVVQARADVLYMVRANKVADSKKLQKRVDDIAKGAALMTGTEFERVFIDGTAELLPNFVIEKLLYDNLCAIGAPVYTEEEKALAQALKNTYPLSESPAGIGSRFDAGIAAQVKKLSDNMRKPLNDFIMPFYSGEGFSPGSTDVGDVSWLCPTSQVETVCWPADVPNHSWQVVASGKSGYACKGMLLAGKVMAAAAIDLIDKPELLEKAKEEFARRSESGYVCPIEADAVPRAL